MLEWRALLLDSTLSYDRHYERPIQGTSTQLIFAPDFAVPPRRYHAQSTMEPAATLWLRVA
jgi:hypothetical protein